MDNSKKEKRIEVFSSDDYLFQKIRLELSDIAEVFRSKNENDTRSADIILIDDDDEEYASLSGIRMKRGGGADIALPFRLGSLLGMLFGSDNGPALRLIPESKCAELSGKEIKLTELEYSLLSLLVSRNGDYVSREEILSKVWGTRADKGIVNVYIHYLREKLEGGCEKIIISSRNYGYKISEKYSGGGNA